MKKFISILATAAMLSAAAVSVSAATVENTVVDELFDSISTNTWTQNGGTATTQEGELLLKSTDSASAITKSSLNIEGDLKLTFNFSTGNTVDSMNVYLGYDGDTDYNNAVMVYQIVKSGDNAVLRYNKKTTNLNNDGGNTLYIRPNVDYEAVIEMKNGKYYLSLTPIGGTNIAAANGQKLTNYEVSDMPMPTSYINLLRFQNNTNSADIMLDNIKLVEYPKYTVSKADISGTAEGVEHSGARTS